MARSANNQIALAVKIIMPTDIIVLPINDDKKKELVGYLTKYFKASVKSRVTQVEGDYKNWLDNYSAKPASRTRTTPFLNASNFMPNLIRMHCDILTARMYGLIMAAKPFWRPTSLLPGLKHEDTENLSEWMQFISFYRLHFPTQLDNILRRAFKTGTVFVKAPWERDELYFPRIDNSRTGIAGDLVTRESLKLQPLPFEDVWGWPITANCLRECNIVFHRLRMTKEEVEVHKTGTQPDWDVKATDFLLSADREKTEPARESRAAEAGIDLSKDVDRPFTAIEAHLRYELVTGQRYKIITTFNPYAEGTDHGYLKGVYSPYRYIENCFTDIILLPREDLIYGYAIPEILEQFQEEQAQIHNARRDRDTVSNVPGWKKKRDPSVPNPSSEWYPGKVFELENLDDLQPLEFAKSEYNSMVEEEGFLLQLAERTTGISPAMQGAGAGSLSGKRGIYASQGVLALLAEGNRRIDIYLRRLREPMHHLGNLIYQSYRTFRPTGDEYTAWGDKGESIKRSFSYAEPADYSGLFFEMGASDSSANKETDRTSLLLMANTMAAYYRQVVEAGSLLQQAGGPNSPIGQILLMVLDGAKDLADRLLFAFDIGDRKRLVPDVRSALGGSPQAGAAQAESLGMPPTEEPVSLGGISDLSDRLGAIASASNGGSPQGGRPQ